MENKLRQRQSKGNGELSDKSQAYLHIHAHALFSSLGRLVRNPFTSAMTIIVMAIAISLASGFYLIVVNMQQLTGNIESTNQISLFLKSNVSDTSAQKLADKIRNNNNVEQVKFISKFQALEEFKVYSGFGDALNMLDKNPLPAVIQVLPKNTLGDVQGVEVLMKKFNHFSQVDFAQMDMQWIKRLQTIMQIIERGVFLLSILLGFAVLFITGNTIRLELQNRRDEVLISKLVGATHSFIQRPFLYTGFWLGFFSGVVAWFLVMVMMNTLQNPIEKLSILYNGAFDVLYLGINETVYLLGITSLLGVIGAWVVLRYQIRQIKPE
ncbi:MAG: permease-like cell division protein FtsX [Methylococcales bacterium]|nr:permease-like cell division protein FtsX [Methylococcales bacterium]